MSDVPRLRAAARDARRLVLQMARRHGAGHPLAGLAACDLLAATLLHARRPDVDRFVLGLPEATAAHHAVLALGGAFPVADLAAPADRRPGVDLVPAHRAEGLAGACGLALGAKLAGSDARTWVLLGAAECRAGAVWEAALVAARHGLDRLTAIVLVPGRGEEPLEKRFRAFGWHVIELNGHDMDRIVAAFHEAGRAAGKPVVVLASTTPGLGVSFMLDAPGWRDRVPTETELAMALLELGGEVALPPGDPAPIAAPAPPAPPLVPGLDLDGAYATGPALAAGLAAAEAPLPTSR